VPAYLDLSPTTDAFQLTGDPISVVTTGAPWTGSVRHLTIGLVNNMPDGALESTERQFLSLLDAASGGLNIRLRLFSMPDICRKGSAASHVRKFYSDVEILWNSSLDGIIVTGREPVAANLVDEPYWERFTTLVEWAREHTYSAVWSCLAAHAAVLHCDGIGRIKSSTKKCGIFDCSRAEDHRLIAGLGPWFKLPHSRWNGVSETALKDRGYRVLSRSEVGADVFVKQHQSLFVFFQGHPEYDSETLMLEYRRDVGRFLKGESKIYPSMPRHYFDINTSAALEAFREQALREPHRELLAKLYGLLLQAKTEASWRTDAIQMYGNWLEHIATQKGLRFYTENKVVRSDWNKTSVVPIRAVNASSSSYLERHVASEERPRRTASGH